MTTKQLVLLCIVFTAIHFFFSFLAPLFIPYLGFFPYKEIAEQSDFPMFIRSFANFDGVNYIIIATQGYLTYNQAFFPVYPILIYLVSFVTGNPLLSGLLISFIAFCGSVVLFARYVQSILREKKEKTFTVWSIVFLLTFPTAFYFNTVYTESIFFFLFISSLYFLQRKQYWLAALFAYFTGLTRIIGIFLFIPFIIHIAGSVYQFTQWKQLLNIKNLQTLLGAFFKKIFSDYRFMLLVTAPFFGLGTYCIYLWNTTGDPFFFFTSQPVFGANRSTSLILPPQVIFRYIKIFIAPLIVPGGQFNFQYYAAWIEFISFVTVSCILLWDFWKICVKKIDGDIVARLGLNLFSWATLILPTLTGTLSSIPRYALLCFAIFLSLAEIKSSVVKIAIALFFSICQVILFGLFIQGYFVG